MVVMLTKKMTMVSDYFLPEVNNDEDHKNFEQVDCNNETNVNFENGDANVEVYDHEDIIYKWNTIFYLF